MTVSLCVVAYNEEKSLPTLLGQIARQTYPCSQTELVLVDSASEDGTRALFSDFAETYRRQYMNIHVCDNPGRSQAAGWNTALLHTAGEIIIRLDAHAEIPEDFIEQNVRLIQSGEDVCGGARPNRIESPTPMKEMLFLAESSMFGSSFASYRRQSEDKQYVDSLFHGAYRRGVFAKVGGFNEDLGRTEDNELHYRIRKAGFRICQGSHILSYQYIRGTLSSMLRQKYGNGKWIGLTMGVCPGCISIFHFVPFCFVLALLGAVGLWFASLLTGIFWLALPLILVGGAYLAADLLMTAAAIASAPQKHPLQLLLPVIFFLLHSSYGIGTLVGLVSLPFWKHRLRKIAERTGGSAQRIEQVRQYMQAAEGKITEEEPK